MDAYFPPPPCATGVFAPLFSTNFLICSARLRYSPIFCLMVCLFLSFFSSTKINLNHELEINLKKSMRELTFESGGEIFKSRKIESQSFRIFLGIILLSSLLNNRNSFRQKISHLTEWVLIIYNLD